MLEGIDLVLKSGEMYFVGPRMSDWGGDDAGGLYFRDTRHLNAFAMAVNGLTFDRLDAQTISPSSATVVDTNPLLRLPSEIELTPHALSLEQHLVLDRSMSVQFVLRNFSGQALSLTCALRMVADFRDLFHIRGMARRRIGDLLDPRMTEDGFALSYRGLDGRRTETAVRFDRPVTIQIDAPGGVGRAEQASLQSSSGTGLPTLPSVTVPFEVMIPVNGVWELNVIITPVPASDESDSSSVGVRHESTQPAARISTDNPAFDRFLEQSGRDLAMLHTCFPDGCLPAAGIPWYVAPFGRDSLIVGLQTVHSAPASAVSTLRTLARLQGTEVDPSRDEAPGKIPHEVRYGEMARLGEVPHGRYYGTIDATPLFILLFAETVTWTGDRRLYEDLLPNVRRAVDWIETDGDPDGDGFIEYRLRTPEEGHLIHPIWKDSVDSLHHPDGRPPRHGLIAPVEVQGYVYAAYHRLAEIVAAEGDAQWATTLERRAQDIRSAVESSFWLEAEGFYAQALDDAKAPVQAISSNAGHLLYCGLPSRERADIMAKRLRQPDLDSGWGIRTLSSTMPTYNPMSYHNGSIWPHDNSLIAAGLHRYGFHREANDITLALLLAAGADPLSRLPELYCGFARDSDAARLAPISYPVSCSPQAWAAGSAQLLVQSMLGLRVDIERGRLLIDPALPEWLDEIKITDMHVLGVPASLSVRRAPNGYKIAGSGPLERATAVGTE